MSRVYNQFCIKCGEDTPHEDLDKKMSCIVCYETMPHPTDPYEDDGTLDMLDHEEDIDSLDEIRDKEYKDWDNGYNYDDWNQVDTT